MTVNGFVRSYGAAVRRAEREQQRENRELAKRFKQQQKQDEIENAQQAVHDWQNYIAAIQSVHKSCTEPIDWNQIKNTLKPQEPNSESKNERIAKDKLQSFKPSFFNKIFGTTQKKIDGLKKQLEEAKLRDTKINTDNHELYLDELKNWEELQNITAGIEGRQVDSYKEALQYFDPFSDIGELGTQVAFAIYSNHIDIDLHVQSVDIIPDYELKQTTSGKLSKKNIPKSRFNELYQDHVCSAALRVAREVFAYLPLEYARVNAMANVLNSKTGQVENQPILSVLFTSKTLALLNFDRIDPSDSMGNFLHRMEFSKPKGFSVIDKIGLEVIQN